MGFLAINVNTYVDIATTIASQGRPYGELRWKCKDPTTKSDFVEPRNGRSEWEERIEYWKNKFPDNGTPIEQCADLKDIEIGTIILQQPIPGMAVWNVLQACYELDRIIFASPKDRKIVAGWEKLPVFEYLDDIQVTEYWKNSLAEFTKEWKRLAEESNEGDFKKPGRKVGSKRRNKKLSSLDDRISDIRRSVDRLEDLWSKLHRTFSQNMKGSMVARNMLDAIGKSIESKFSMIGSALTGEENKEVPNDPLKKASPGSPPDPKPLSGAGRKNSFKDMMHEPAAKGKQIAVAAAVEKDKWATLQSMAFVAILVGVLSLAQRYLVAC